ncbi:pentapeptide repeat-containing protein [Gulosibacter sp. ACHW.36C]|uniref:Pentapeptide repeat-containing protein n=1 Tax=Gulosibacter sediminis TaxID=1729695 RepID=A0ABY4MUH0_9MICO|nr:pentapeptide repeat-containing protein [Gulosibacter sediminis]UQN13827.1 pentapeptide repeat-containing protein [Gulosibacter sediminis]
MAAKRSAKITAPMIDELRLPDLLDARSGDVVAGGFYEARRYTEADLAGRDLSSVTFSECEFLGLDAHAAQLHDARIVETRLERVSAPELKATGSGWRDVRIESSRLGAVDLSEADLRAVQLTASKVSFANLRAATLRDVRFEHCVIEELDLTQARVDRVAFLDCAVRTLILDQAKLQHLDLRGAELDRVRGLASMRGAIVTYRQAADLTETFADHLGITIAD